MHACTSREIVPREKNMLDQIYATSRRLQVPFRTGLWGHADSSECVHGGSTAVILRRYQTSTTAAAAVQRRRLRHRWQRFLQSIGPKQFHRSASDCSVEMNDDLFLRFNVMISCIMSGAIRPETCLTQKSRTSICNDEVAFPTVNLSSTCILGHDAVTRFGCSRADAIRIGILEIFVRPDGVSD
ncbi:unnamed protein product [Trichogramma brassicae]|uniref:Uncharacterized protein n=1 Tax=Trichogramma brassicae TaxID=86971 RepID=A0A6H5J6L8_9HYME|nr:unnamed protein product [Trichogramma brassicae]